MIVTIGKAKKYFENCDKKGLAVISNTHSFKIPTRQEDFNSMSDAEIIKSANSLEDLERYQSNFRGMGISDFLECINNV